MTAYSDNRPAADLPKLALELEQAPIVIPVPVGKAGFINIKPAR